jgi:hypothetical protein
LETNTKNRSMIINFVFEHGRGSECLEKADEAEVPRALPLVRFIGCITIPGRTIALNSIN